MVKDLVRGGLASHLAKDMQCLPKISGLKFQGETGGASLA
jgi:hypothetical protein